MDRINAILTNERYQSCIQAIKRYETERIFCRHDMEHFLSVARIMYIKSMEEQINLEKDILYAAALLHDIGRASQYETGRDHARAGEEIAKKILEECGYRKEEIETIAAAVLTHHGKRESQPLSALLQYADQMSRNCFLCPASRACHWPEWKKNKGVLL